jgi:hypothetical protein
MQFDSLVITTGRLPCNWIIGYLSKVGPNANDHDYNWLSNVGPNGNEHDWLFIKGWPKKAWPPFGNDT